MIDKFIVGVRFESEPDRLNNYYVGEIVDEKLGRMVSKGGLHKADAELLCCALNNLSRISNICECHNLSL